MAFHVLSATPSLPPPPRHMSDAAIVTCALCNRVATMACAMSLESPTASCRIQGGTLLTSKIVQIMKGAVNTIFLGKKTLSLDVISQFQVKLAGSEQKFHVLERFIFANADRLGQTIIFVRTRETARVLHDVCLSPFSSMAQHAFLVNCSSCVASTQSDAWCCKAWRHRHDCICMHT
jgi:hypothetical protein